MAYKTLYRKYRPMSFEDVCGQNYIVTTLKNAIENNKISHAYLFTGTRGTGKTTIAKIFAKSVNCLNRKEGLPCNNCEICNCNNTDEIPDIIEIDAASNNGVDEIRELKNKIKIMPVLCKYKVYIIDEVHMLSTGAFNALLKTLEEPPEHVIFILATTEPQKLPITIISRCQRFDFKRIPEEIICSRLKYISKNEKISIDDEAILEIAKLSGGAMRDAIGLLDQLASYSSKKITVNDIYELKGSISNNELINLVEMYINRDIINMLDLIEKIYNDNKSFNILAEDMLLLFRNIYISKVAPKYLKKINLINEDKIIDLSKKLSSKSIEKIIERMEKLVKIVNESNYPRVIFEVNLLAEFETSDNLVELTETKNTSVKSAEKIVESNKKTKEEKLVKSEEIVKEKLIEPEIKDKKLEEKNSIKEAIINNTIAKATNIYKKEIKESFLNLDKYLISKKYKNAATILKDSVVSAASEDHILLTYKYDSMVDSFDNDMENITNLVEKMLNRRYKIVSITDNEWKEKRPYYVELKKSNGEIKLLEENEDKKNIKPSRTSEDIDDYIDIFGGELVEMEG